MRDALDRYYTPDHVAEACVQALQIAPPSTIYEPSVGGGAFVRACLSRWPEASITAGDMDEEARGLHGVRAPLFGDMLCHTPAAHDLAVGNPPYREAEAHVRHLLACGHRCVALLLRLGFLASQRRASLFAEYPVTGLHVLTRRPSFTGKGTDSSDYALFVWDRSANAQVVRWIS